MAQTAAQKYRAGKLSPQDHALVTAAVREAERASAAEIVTVVSDRSDHYGDVPLLWAGGLSLLALSFLAAMPRLHLAVLDALRGGWIARSDAATSFLFSFLAAVMVFIAAWALLQWLPLRMALTPRDFKIARTHRRAVAVFRVAAEGRTRGRTGVLIYLSLAERRAEIVADAAVTQVIPPEAWGDVMDDMLDHVREGRTAAGMAAAVQAAGKLLAPYFPQSAADQNELDDRLIEI